MIKRVLGAVAIVVAGVAGIQGLTVVPAAASTTAIPYQFIAKVYSEGLGRAPDQAAWASTESYYQANGCDATTLKYIARLALDSAEFYNLGYSNPALVLVAYRTILNREVDTTGYVGSLSALNGGTTWLQLIDMIFASSEFSGLANTICRTSTPDYNFGTTPATTIEPGATGLVGTQAQLQALLNATASGGTVTLAQRAVVRVNSSLTIPSGVTLTTAGSPGPARYAEQGRIVRDNVWPTFAAPAVVLQAGAKLSYVWVDGQMGDPARYLQGAPNVRVLSGTNSAVTYSRLGNSAGNTALSVKGGGDPLPGSGTFINCVTNNYSYNFVEAYSSDHFNGHWSDGLSIGCENSTVVGNQVVDASDVGIITFGEQGKTQNSLVSGNTVVNAGNGAYGSLGIDPWQNPAGGDAGGTASRDFTGSVMESNVFWNNVRAPNAIGIAVGARAWTAQYGYNGYGQIVPSNTTGTLGLWAGNGIIVSGMLSATVFSNTISLTIVTGQSNCTTAAVGAAITAGHASGRIERTPLDTNYYGCIVGLTN